MCCVMISTDCIMMGDWQSPSRPESLEDIAAYDGVNDWVGEYGQPLSWRACREFCKIKCEKIWWVRKKVVLLRCSTIIRGFPKPDIPLGKPSDKRHKKNRRHSPRVLVVMAAQALIDG